MRINVRVFLLTVLVIRTTFAQDGPVRTLPNGGRLRGLVKTVTIDGKSADIYTFLGIPFARPPVGILRFAPPEPYGTWTGIKNATSLKSTCWQYIFSGFDLNNPAAKIWVNNTDMSEDCLYLNVWTPMNQTTSSPVAVMVWIYGGSYSSGSANLDVYDGSFLATTQNVVVVSMQYRVGAFGFLRLDPNAGTGFGISGGTLNSTSPAMGNQGLLDQLLALKWVRENIGAFGGDPNRVTVFGESTGAVSTSILWLSPLAQQYMQRIILQSSSVLARWAISTPEEAHSKANEFAVSCGCPSPTIDREATLRCLQGLDPITLVDKLDSIAQAVGERRYRTLRGRFPQLQLPYDPSTADLPGWATSTRMCFDVLLRPVVDGHLIPINPDEMFQQQYQGSLKRSSQVLLGVNKNEAMYFLMYGLAMNDTVFIHEDGSVTLPQSINLAGQRSPLQPGGTLADFHWITAIEILDENLLNPLLSKLPAMQYGLPMHTNTSPGYADPNVVRLTGEEVMRRMDDLLGDLEFKCPTLQFAELASAVPGTNVYVYSFERRTEATTMPEWLGVMHGYEIEYVFGMPFSEKFKREYYTFSSAEQEISKKIMTYWGNFAKYGNPNQNDDSTVNLVRWPLFKPAAERNSTDDDYLILDTVFRSDKGLRLDGCRFWLHDIEDLRKRYAQDDLDRNRNSVQGVRITDGSLITVCIWDCMLFCYLGALEEDPFHPTSVHKTGNDLQAVGPTIA
ncbi:unnamed protein product [Calicophoron daubneyi]|uniref:Carboxylesterase type B domain-containing protein n=1 Tax=Calicophoron daubneyi TaxID=300641 RepID=A0AAV2TYE1_CALDB